MREKHMELLTSHTANIIATEKSIYDNGMMLEQVNMENSRLHVVRDMSHSQWPSILNYTTHSATKQKLNVNIVFQCIEQMKEDIWNTRKDQERHTKEIGWLKEEVHSLFGEHQPSSMTPTIVNRCA